MTDLRSIVAIPMIALLMLSGCLSDLAENNTDDDLNLYLFSGQDAPRSQDLVEVNLDSGSGLEWDLVVVNITVDGGPSQTCSDGNNSATGGPCSYWDTPGHDWAPGHFITITGDCTGASAECEVEVSITKKGDVPEDDQVIGVIIVYTE
jgi:hypothetical protein